jgi:hypothetical protein
MCNTHCNCNITISYNPCHNVYYDYAGFKCVKNPCIILQSQPNSSKAKYIKEYGLGNECFDKCNNLINNNTCVSKSYCNCCETTAPPTSCNCCETTAPSTSCDCCETTVQPTTCHTNPI